MVREDATVAQPVNRLLVALVAFHIEYDHATSLQQGITAVRNRRALHFADTNVKVVRD